MTDEVRLPAQAQADGLPAQAQADGLPAQAQADGGDKPAPRRPARIIGLDGVRGLGSLAVVFAHVAVNYSPHIHDEAKLGLLGLALILFFVLSGFLLFLPIVRRLTAPADVARMPDTRDYTLHRILRVFPAYLVIFLICNFIFQIAYVANPTLEPKGTTAGTGMITDPGQLLANLTLLQTYFPQYVQTGINPSWSLTLEIAFYVSLPVLGLLLFALRRRTGVRPLLLACVAPAVLFVVGIVGRLFIPLVISTTGVATVELQNWGPNWAAVYLRSFLSNSDLFAYGMVGAILFVAIEQGVVRQPVARRLRIATAVTLLASMVVALKLAAGQSPFATSAIGVVSGLLLLVIVMPLAHGGDSRMARWLDAKPVHYVGLISLSVYLWHYPVLLLMGRYGLAGGDSLSGMMRNELLVMAVTLVLASITYYLVERPALNSVRRFRRR